MAPSPKRIPRWPTIARDGCNWSYIVPVVIALQRGLTLAAREDQGRAIVMARLLRDGGCELWVGRLLALRGDAFDVGCEWFSRINFNDVNEVWRVLEGAGGAPLVESVRQMAFGEIDERPGD